jgi:membrane protein required for colicin V production
MTVFDLAVVVVVGLSMFLGWWRGLVYESVSLLSWVAAYFVARLFALDIVDDVPASVGTEPARMAVAFAILFGLTLVAGGVLAWGMNKLVDSAGLARLDGSLGAAFGLLRGGFLVIVLVMLCGMTSLPGTSAWRDALTSSTLEGVAIEARAWLPQGLAQKIHFRD